MVCQVPWHTGDSKHSTNLLYLLNSSLIHCWSELFSGNMVAAKGVASVLEVLSELTNILKLFLSASPQWGAISLDVKYNGIAL